MCQKREVSNRSWRLIRAHIVWCWVYCCQTPSSLIDSKTTGLCPRTRKRNAVMQRQDRHTPWPSITTTSGSTWFQLPLKSCFRISLPHSLHWGTTSVSLKPEGNVKGIAQGGAPAMFCRRIGRRKVGVELHDRSCQYQGMARVNGVIPGHALDELSSFHQNPTFSQELLPYGFA